MLLSITWKIIFGHSIIILRFGDKKSFMLQKYLLKFCDVNVDNTVIWKQAKTKTNYKSLIVY